MAHKELRVALFGTFDGVHDGHRYLFRQARKFGKHLTVIVARDSSVLQLKHQVPKFTEALRLDLVSKEDQVDDAVLGDAGLSGYQILSELDPDVVCLGYDQQKLGVDLRLWMEKSGKTYPVYYLKPCNPQVLHNSLLQSVRF